MKLDWAWFQRRFWDLRMGHSTYLAFALSMINFVVLNYNLLIANVSFLHNVFQHIWLFALIFIITYIPSAIFIGYKFYRKKQLAIDQEVSLKENPYFQDLAKAIVLLAQGNKEEVRELMKKWIRE